MVREVLPSGHVKGWRVELLDDLPAMLKPLPFTQAKHYFLTLEAAVASLGDASVVKDD